EGEELCTHWGDFMDFIGLRRQGPGCSAAVSALAVIEPSLVSVWTDDFRTPIGPMFGYELADVPPDDESYEGHVTHPDMGMFTITAVDLLDAAVLVNRWYDWPDYWAFAIATELLEHEAAIAAFYEDADDLEVKVWRHACVGDWIAADAAAIAMGDATLR